MNEHRCLERGYATLRVAFGALLFTILGVAVDVAANVINVMSTKREMAEVEDEAAQVFAQSRQA